MITPKFLLVKFEAGLVSEVIGAYRKEQDFIDDLVERTVIGSENVKVYTVYDEWISNRTGVM